MAKTNFTKAEEALAKELDKMLKAKILEEADQASGQQSSNDGQDKLVLIMRMQRDLKRLHAKEKGSYEEIDLPKSILRALVKTPEKLKSKSWKELKEIKDALDRYRHELKKRYPGLTDEELIQLEMEKHINKRFNIRDDWLPLQ